MGTPHEALVKYAAANGLKMTPQRRVILDEFMNSKGHLSSEELYGMIKAREPSIGQATVYRTLKLLTAAGLAKSVDFGDGVTRYESTWGREHHDHLICERCKKSVGFMEPAIERLQEELARRHGFTLTHHEMYLYGLCSECRGKEKEENEEE